MRLAKQEIYDLVERMAHEGNPELVLAPTNNILPEVPLEWKSILCSSDPVSGMQQLWAPMSDRLPRVCRAMEERLLGVGFLRTDDVTAGLLYFFGNKSGVLAYRGQAPMREYEINTSALPKEFLDFYRIHNGWVLDYDEDEGPLPSSRWIQPSEWGEETRFSPSPGLSTFSDATIVYRSGDDVAFAYDCSSPPATPLLLAPPAQVEALADMWAAIDDHVSRFLLSCDRQRRGTSDSLPIKALDQQLERITISMRTPNYGAGAATYRHWFRLLLERASLDSNNDHFHQNALRAACAAIERSSLVEPDELLSLFGLAESLGDKTSSYFIATVPERLWMNGTPEAVRLSALFELFHGHGDVATLLMEQFFPGPGPDFSERDLNANISSLIASLVEHNGIAYRHYRSRILKQDLGETDEYGICLSWSIRIAACDRIARDQGLLGT